MKKLRFIIFTIYFCISSIFFCGCSRNDQLFTAYLLLAPVGAIQNVTESFKDPVCSEKENGAVVRVVDDKNRPIKEAEIHVYLGDREVYWLTNKNGESLLRTPHKTVKITRIAKKKFKELNVSEVITLFRLSSDCKSRNIKSFLEKHRPMIYQLEK